MITARAVEPGHGVLVPVIRHGQQSRGWPEHETGARAAYVSLAHALTTAHDSDAHFAAYSVPHVERRLATEFVFSRLPDGVPVVLFLVDVEPDGHAPVSAEWWSGEFTKIERLLADHPGGYVYRTRGGYRVVYHLAEPVTLRSVADAERWRRTYQAWLAYVADRYSIIGDRACSDWTRLYRLPRVVRDGQRLELETVGDPNAIGLWAPDVTVPEPVVSQPKPRPILSSRQGDFDIDTFMAAQYPGVECRSVLGGRRWDIECPWQHEHSTKAQRETSVFATDAGRLGFKCQHNHCADRRWREFRQWHQPDWVPFDERAIRRDPPREREVMTTATEAYDYAEQDSTDDGSRFNEVPLPDREDDGPCEIVINHDIAGIVDAAEQALCATREVYVRGQSLVQIVRGSSGQRWLEAASERTPFIHVLRKERLREMIGAAAVWKKVDKRSQRLERTMPPEWVAPTLLQRGEWIFAPLQGVTDIPILRHDGTIHDVPGYDEQTGMIYDPCGVTWPSINSAPTRADAVAAYAELAEPFRDFPFVAESDRAAAIALILSVVGRSAIRGNVPMFTSCATTPGSGKGLVVDAAVTIGTGNSAAKMLATRNDEEARKRLLAIALSAPPVVMFDNVSGEFRSEALEMALTAGAVRDRLLGGNEETAVPLHSVFVLTGNNVQIGGDLPRRVVPIDLDPKCEHPEDRRGFKHPDLLAYVRRDRPRLVVAALTLMRAYCAAGSPPHGQPAKGSFEQWDALVRGSIIWAGAVDPLGGVSRLRERGDVELNRLRALMGAWVAEFGERSVLVSDVIAAGRTNPTLQLAIDAYARHGETLTGNQLGSRLARLRGRVADGRCFHDDGDARTGVKFWRVGAP